MKKKIIVAGFAMAMAVVGTLSVCNDKGISSQTDLASLIAVNSAQAEFSFDLYNYKCNSNDRCKLRLFNQHHECNSDFECSGF